MPALGPIGHRLFLILLTVWGLAMVMPDLDRPFHPLGSFGMSANNDGLVTDVQGPFPDEASSPAWQAGLRKGDRLDLQQMRCLPVATLRCATAEALLGGLLFVSDNRRAEIVLKLSDGQPAGTVLLAAHALPFSWTVTLVLLLDQIAAVLVILAAAWLVFTRPGAMTWAFFMYVVWFNPGQSSVFYAVLQRSPAALLVQNLAGALAQGVGLAALLVFVVKVPTDRSAARWRHLLRAMPVIAAALGLLLLSSYANLFGYPTEALTRAGVTTGFIVAVAALAILLARRSELAPADYQRLRWVLWGCLIGLPALSLADLGQETTLLNDLVGRVLPTDITWDLLRLVNGVLCLFVFEAVRRPRVVNVAIPLRRVTLLGLMLSFPALLLHQQVDHFREAISESVELPAWVWLAIAAGVVFAISRLHEWAVDIADHHFNRRLIRAGQQIGATILEAPEVATVDRALSAGVCETLGLTSATLFHVDGSGFSYSPSGTDRGVANPTTLRLDAALLKSFEARQPFDIPADTAQRLGFAIDPARPVLAVPIAGRFQRYGLAFYGEHITGIAFNRDERAVLAELAAKATETYTKLELEMLHRRIVALEQRLGVAQTDAMTEPQGGLTTQAGFATVG